MVLKTTMNQLTKGYFMTFNHQKLTAHLLAHAAVHFMIYTLKMNKHTQSGFTLIELLVTITIACLVAGFAVPSIQSLVQSNYMIAKTNYLRGSISFARSIAISEFSQVTFCASDDQTTCSGNNTWENGWIIYTTDDAGINTIHKVGEDVSSTLTITVDYFYDPTTLTFDEQGQVLDASNIPGLRGTFTICNENGASDGRVVNINTQGRAQKSYKESSSSTVKDITGVSITCS